MPSTVLVRRKERRPPPRMPSGEILIESPPAVQKSNGPAFHNALLYFALAGGAATIILVIADVHADRIQKIAMSVLALTVMAATAGQLGRLGTSRPRAATSRRLYLEYLRQEHRRLGEIARNQRAALTWRNPAPERLWSMVMSSRLWERRPGDEDFGIARIGVGPQPVAVQLVVPETGTGPDLDPSSADALHRFLRTCSTIPDLPVGLSLKSFSRVTMSGERDATCGMVRAMIMQLVAFHSPDDMRISVCASRDRTAYWEWVKWLPHALHPTSRDDTGPVRLFAESLADLSGLLETEIGYRSRFTRARGDGAETPLHVVILDGGARTPIADIGTEDISGVCVIDLGGSMEEILDDTTLRIEVSHDEARTRYSSSGSTTTTSWVPDHVGFSQAESLARQLAPLRTGLGRGGASENYLAGSVPLTALLGVDRPGDIDPDVAWRPQAPRNRLRVPIGVDTEGRPVELDIKESAQSGDGPHGLCIGATGSGRSELLRTIVLGLATTHSPAILNFVLVDFKGAATFAGMERLRHVAALVTGLEDDLQLVDRLHDALQGELMRRQEMLRTAGNHVSQAEYERSRERGAELPPMPALFVVFDEFSELLSAKPDFIELFVMIGRLGRSLGVHLLLAAQRLEEGKLRGLETHLSYRIGLRTSSAMESRVVLGVPDAYDLPRAPGNGYLKAGTDQMVRFRAANVSGAYDPDDGVQGGGRAQVKRVTKFLTGYQPPAVEKPPREHPVDEDHVRESLLDVVVKRLAGHGPSVHPLWLPPLDQPVTLDQVLPALRPEPGVGLTTADGESRGRLFAAIGVVDRPFEHRRETLWVDLSGSAGHAAVVGGPQSGKSTTLRTLVTSLALTHTPQEAQFYCLDFGGGALGALEPLPHVCGVAGRQDPRRVRRTVAEVTSLLAERERYFTAHGIDGTTVFRRLRASGELPVASVADVFLVVDNWSVLRQDFEEIEAAVIDLAARGLGYGIHVLASANRWADFRPAGRDLLGSRLELRLGDPFDSLLDRRAAIGVPEGRPGRGIVRDGLHFLTALPRIDGVSGVDDLADGVRGLVEAVAANWPGPVAPKVRMLPAEFPQSSLPPVSETGRRVPIGIAEDDLKPVSLNFATNPHFLVIGDNECGKTNLLRIIANALVERYTPEEARFIFLDYRRGLLDVGGDEHRIGYAASSTAASQLIRDVEGAMAGRLPSADVTPDQLRTRSWWKGPDLFVFVDDYELVATSANPLLPLAELILNARDIGLHLIVARSMGGAGRSMYDPIIHRITEMTSPALIMSGSREEGHLAGVKPLPMPPGQGIHVDRRRRERIVQTALCTDGGGGPAVP